MTAIKLSHVVVAGALVLAMGGTATASSMITSQQIKDGTITTMQRDDAVRVELTHDPKCPGSPRPGALHR